MAEAQESETAVEEVVQKEEVELQQDAVAAENIEHVDRSWIYYPPRKDAEDRHLSFSWCQSWLRISREIVILTRIFQHPQGETWLNREAAQEASCFYSLQWWFGAVLPVCEHADPLWASYDLIHSNKLAARRHPVMMSCPAPDLYLPFHPYRPCYVSSTVQGWTNKTRCCLRGVAGRAAKNMSPMLWVATHMFGSIFTYTNLIDVSKFFGEQIWPTAALDAEPHKCSGCKWNKMDILVQCYSNAIAIYSYL